MAFTASYIYEILDRYSAPLRRITQQTAQFEERTKKSVSTIQRLSNSLTGMRDKVTAMSNRLNRAGASMANFRTAVGAAGAAGALKGIIGTAVAFESSLNRVESVTYASAEGMKMLRDQAKELGRTTQFSANQAAEGMAFLGMAGIKTNDILKTMPGMLNLAAAGNLSLADASAKSTDILTAFELPLSQIGHLSDVLAFAAGNANTNVYELAEAMKNTAKTAQLTGVSVEETTAMLMAMANSGIQGGEAGTQLMNALKALSVMSKKTGKGLAKLGIDPRKILDSEGKIRDLTGLIGQLAAKKVKMGELFDIFDIRGAKAIATIMGVGKKNLTRLIKDLKKADGTARKMAEILMEGAPGAILRFQSAFEGLILTMAEYVLPTFTRFIEKLTTIISKLQANYPRLLKFAVIGLTVAAAIGAIIVPLGILLSTIGAVMPLLAGLLHPLVLLGIIVAGLGIKFINFKNIISSAKESLKTFKEEGKFDVLLNELKRVFTSFKISFGHVKTSILELLSAFGSIIGISSKSMKNFDYFGFIFSTVADSVVLLVRVLNILASVLGNLLNVAFKTMLNVKQKVKQLDFKGAWKTFKEGGLQSVSDIKNGISGIVDLASKKLPSSIEKGVYQKDLSKLTSEDFEKRRAKIKEIAKLAKLTKPEAMKATTELAATEAPKPYLTPRTQLQDMAKSRLAVTQTAKAEISGRIRLEGDQTRKVKAAEFDAPLGNNLEFAY